jgi:broad specificity phosphatase PhoE
MKTIYFIRHAESEANAGNVTFDDASTVLTETGKEQARKLSEQLSESPDLIIYSKYIRTQQTAAQTILKFPKVLTEMSPLHELTYLSPKICQGTTIHSRKNWVFDYWNACNPYFIHGTGAESFIQFIARIEKCLSLLETSKAQNIYIFTHGYVLRIIWQIFLGHKFSSDYERTHHFYHHMYKFRVPNTCIYKAILLNNQWHITEPQSPDLFS